MTTPIFSATGSTQAEARAVIDADSPTERDAAITAALVAYDWKPAVRVRAQAAVVIAGPGAAIDGTGMVVGDRFLTNVQGGALPGTTNAANGLYVWQGAAVAATRATDFAVGSDAGGAAVKVNEGTDADKIFVCITDTTVGNAIAFQQSGFVGTIDNTTHGALSYQTPAPAQHHSTVVAGVSPGFMSAADKTKLDAYAATYVAGRVLRGSGAAYADSTATYPDTVAAGDLVCATGAAVVGVVAGPGATVSILKHTGSGGTNLPAHISLAGAGVDAYKLLQANAAGNDYALDMLSNSGHGGLGFQTLAAVQHHSNAVAGVSPGFLSAADKTKLDALPTVLAFCGTGADGAAVLMAAGGGTVPAGMTDDGGGLYHLTRDCNTTTFMQEVGSILQTRGFFLRCSTSLWTEGTIHAAGANGANAGAGGGAAGAAGAVGTLRSGTAGGAGNNAGAGAAGAADVSGLGGPGGAGGAGGNNVGANAGGAAGAVTAPTAVMGDWQNAWAALLSFLPGYNAGVTAWPQGGSGGGGGGSGVTNVGTTSNGGGGGAGGGILKIASPTITINGAGVLSANGGSGGTGGDGTAGNDDGGGGGGGGGGGVALVFRTTYTGAVPTATGGPAGGHGHLMPAGAGADGADGTVGTAGLVIQFTV